MILGNGIDLVKNQRIAALIDKYEEHFLNKIYTKNEIKYCRSKSNASVSFAARFAAKEAMLKALGTGMRNNSWKEIEVINNKLGKPEITLSGKTEALAESKNIKSIFLSISHEKKYSIAQIILEGDK